MSKVKPKKMFWRPVAESYTNLNKKLKEIRAKGGIVKLVWKQTKTISYILPEGE